MISYDRTRKTIYGVAVDPEGLRVPEKYFLVIEKRRRDVLETGFNSVGLAEIECN